MADEEQRLAEEARRSREETAKLRDEGVEADAERTRPSGDEQDEMPDNPWAKTSSGDADDVTDDD